MGKCHCESSREANFVVLEFTKRTLLKAKFNHCVPGTMILVLDLVDFRQEPMEKLRKMIGRWKQ